MATNNDKPVDVSLIMNSVFRDLFKAGTLKQVGDKKLTYRDLSEIEKAARNAEIDGVVTLDDSTKENLEKKFSAINLLIESDRMAVDRGPPPLNTYIRTMDYGRDAYNAFIAARNIAARNDGKIAETQPTRDEVLHHAVGLIHGALGFYPLLVEKDKDGQGIKEYLNTYYIPEKKVPEGTVFSLVRLFQGFARIWLCNMVRHHGKKDEDGETLDYLEFLGKQFQDTVKAANDQYDKFIKV